MFLLYVKPFLYSQVCSYRLCVYVCMTAVVWDPCRQAGTRLQLLALSGHSSLGELQITPAFSSRSVGWLCPDLAAKTFNHHLPQHWTRLRPWLWRNPDKGDLWSPETKQSLLLAASLNDQLTCKPKSLPQWLSYTLPLPPAWVQMQTSNKQKPSPITPLYLHVCFYLSHHCHVDWASSPKDSRRNLCFQLSTLDTQPPTTSTSPHPSHPQSPLSQSEEEERQGGVEEKRGKEIDE